MTDHFHFTMAALDHDGAVLASKGKRSSDADSDSEASKKKRSKQLAKKSSGGIPSAIFFRPAKGGWANKRFVSLPPLVVAGRTKGARVIVESGRIWCCVIIRLHNSV